MKKQEIIELLAKKCNGVDLPMSLDINLIADILVNEQLHKLQNYGNNTF